MPSGAGIKRRESSGWSFIYRDPFFGTRNHVFLPAQPRTKVGAWSVDWRFVSLDRYLLLLVATGRCIKTHGQIERALGRRQPIGLLIFARALVLDVQVKRTICVVRIELVDVKAFTRFKTNFFHLRDDRLVSVVGRIDLKEFGGVCKVLVGRHGVDLYLGRRFHVDARVNFHHYRLHSLAPM